MARELFEYHGAFYTMAELCRMTNLHRDTIRRRLEWGWSIERIFNAAFDQPECQAEIGKRVPIIFREDVPVVSWMQPTIGRKYYATVCGSSRQSQLSKVFYVIELENGKKLVTYPGEFEFVKEPDGGSAEG